MPKLPTPDDVRDIRSAAKQRAALREVIRRSKKGPHAHLRNHIKTSLTNEALARKYQMHVRTVARIIYYETWGNIT